MLKRCFGDSSRFQTRVVSQALMDYLSQVWRAMRAQTQSELPYLYEKKIHLAKQKCIYLLMKKKSSQSNASLLPILAWCLQLNLLRRLLDDSDLLQLSFEPFLELYQAIVKWLNAQDEVHRTQALQVYEQAFLRFESFYEQVLRTASNNILPWEAWLGHLKHWSQVAGAELAGEQETRLVLNRDDPMRFNRLIRSFFSLKSFKLFSESLCVCLQPLLTIFDGLAAYPELSQLVSDDHLENILNIHLHPAYPSWVFQNGFNPFFRSSWRYFLLELEKYLDSTFLILFSVRKTPSFSEIHTCMLTSIFQTEKQLFDILLACLKQHRLIEVSQDLEGDVLSLSQIILSAKPSDGLHEDRLNTQADELCFYYVIAQHRMAILNLLHAFPVGE